MTSMFIILINILPHLQAIGNYFHGNAHTISERKVSPWIINERRICTMTGISPGSICPDTAREILNCGYQTAFMKTKRMINKKIPTPLLPLSNQQTAQSVCRNPHVPDRMGREAPSAPPATCYNVTPLLKIAISWNPASSLQTLRPEATSMI